MPTPEAVPVRGSESMGPPSLVQTGVSELGTTRGKSVTAGLDREASDADADSSLPKSGLKELGTEPLDSVCPSLLAQSTRQRLQGRVLAPWERYGLTSGFTRIGEHKVAGIQFYYKVCVIPPHRAPHSTGMTVTGQSEGTPRSYAWWAQATAPCHLPQALRRSSKNIGLTGESTVIRMAAEPAAKALERGRGRKAERKRGEGKRRPEREKGQAG